MSFQGDGYFKAQRAHCKSIQELRLRVGDFIKIFDFALFQHGLWWLTLNDDKKWLKKIWTPFYDQFFFSDSTNFGVKSFVLLSQNQYKKLEIKILILTIE